MTRCRPHGAKLCKTVHQNTCGKFAQLLFWEVVVEPNSKRSSLTIVFERPIAFCLIVDISSLSPSESKVDAWVSWFEKQCYESAGPQHKAFFQFRALVENIIDHLRLPCN